MAGLRWILANRPGLASMRALSRAAGRAPSHVEHILSGRSSADISLDLARDLARAGNVRLAWLLTGEGEREPFSEIEQPPSPEDRYPSRRAGLQAALALGIPEVVIAEMLRHAPPEDLGAQGWLQWAIDRRDQLRIPPARPDLERQREEEHARAIDERIATTQGRPKEAARKGKR